MNKTIIAQFGRYDVTHEPHPFEPSVTLYYVSIVLGDSYRHYISSHLIESKALEKAQQLQEIANVSTHV